MEFGMETVNLLNKKKRRLKETKDETKNISGILEPKKKRKTVNDIGRKLKSYPSNKDTIGKKLFESFKKYLINANILLSEPIKEQTNMSFLHNREILSLERTYSIADDMVIDARMDLNCSNDVCLVENNEFYPSMRKIYHELGRKIFENSKTSVEIGNIIRIKILEKIFGWSAEDTRNYVLSHWNASKSDQENITNAMYYIGFFGDVSLYQLYEFFGVEPICSSIDSNVVTSYLFMKCGFLELDNNSFMLTERANNLSESVKTQVYYFGGEKLHKIVPRTPRSPEFCKCKSKTDKINKIKEIYYKLDVFMARLSLLNFKQICAIIIKFSVPSPRLALFLLCSQKDKDVFSKEYSQELKALAAVIEKARIKTKHLTIEQKTEFLEWFFDIYGINKDDEKKEIESSINQYYDYFSNFKNNRDNGNKYDFLKDAFPKSTDETSHQMILQNNDNNGRIAQPITAEIKESNGINMPDPKTQSDKEEDNNGNSKQLSTNRFNAFNDDLELRICREVFSINNSNNLQNYNEEYDYSHCFID